MKYIKIFPLVAIASWHKNAGGAYRAWRIAHCADKPGTGMIVQSELKQFMRLQGIPARSRQLWIKQALELGLLKTFYNNKTKLHLYELVSLGRGAVILGCPRIGKRAEIKRSYFIRPGWKNYIWGAYEKTLNGPVSQAVKQELTGVTARQQQRYLKQIPVKKVKNYAERSKNPEPGYLALCRDTTKRAVFINNTGQVMQRLPNRIKVPNSVARRSKGKGIRAQTVINKSSDMVKRGPIVAVRLFHDNSKDLRKSGKSPIPVKHYPDNVFLLSHRKTGARFWECVAY